MDHSLRLQYLESMGIDVWIPKEADIDRQAQSLSGNEESVISVVDSVQELDEWSILKNEVDSCERCQLYQSRSQTVFGVGNKNADWMLIGDVPGQQEDLQGLPFVGAAGYLLTEIIRSIGIQRDDVYIANILKCRTPDDRRPKQQEIETCHQYLQKQVNWVKPKIILAVGEIAAQNLLKSTETLSQLRGKPYQFNDIPLVVIYHPAYLLKSLLEKRKAWQDIKLALKIYQKLEK